MLIATIVVISLLFMLSYFIFDRDLLAPPTAVALVFLFGSFCTFYNEKRWGLEFSIKSMGLIAAGIIATMLGGLIGVWLCTLFKKGGNPLSHTVTRPEEIRIETVKTVIVIALQLFTMYLIFSYIRRVTGYSSWMEAVKRYRDLTGEDIIGNDLSLQMSFLTRNLAQVSRMLGTVYAYVIGNNLIASKRKVSLNWAPVILYSITTFMQGDRSNMLRLWVVAMMTAYIVHKRSVGWRNSRQTKKIIRTMALSVVLVGAFFAGIREVVGRTSDLDPLRYVTFYAGSPIAILDQTWVKPVPRPEIFGERILYSLNATTTVLFGWPGHYFFYYDFFKSPNGSMIGNAPTAFRPAYTEFGFWGFFLVMTLFGVFYMVLYCRSRTKRGNSPIDFNLLIYSHISYVFLMYFYSTFFDFLGHIFIKYMIELLIIRWLLVDVRFRGTVISIGWRRNAGIFEMKPKCDNSQ